MHILYLTHDVLDTTTAKRVRMLLAGGAHVTIAGFRRSDTAITILEACPVIDLGRTHNNRFAQRIASVIRTVCTARQHQKLFAQCDLILARNLEMLAIAVRGRSLCATPPALVYESLDIHRLLLRNDAIGKGLRTLEGLLSRRAGLLITSSPAFIRDYFEKRSKVNLPTILLENKVFTTTPISSITAPSRPAGPPWRIGWFGAIRCRQSLDILCEVARANPGLIEVIIRGRPSYDQFENFDAQVKSLPNLRFLGSYRNPDELAAMYSDVHFTWAIDMFEEGLNSAWLLPNRLYEGGIFATVPLAASGTETSRTIQSLNIGHTLSEPKAAALTNFLRDLTPEKYQSLQAASLAVPVSKWQCGPTECEALVTQFAKLLPAKPTPLPAANASLPLLVIVPCLNEAAHIGALLDYLVAESQTCAMRIVIADGGSTDGTIDIIKHYASAHTHIHYLPNPKRIQSAAINLAVATFAEGSDYFIRMDAHAHFPRDYCQALRDDALATGADSVVVAMRTIGTKPFQAAVAAAQNSKLGNGGAAHRNLASAGRWVDHGHHALMRIAAYNAVHGYDETFTHNEDAELDTRLRRAGFRIWLTANTQHDYFPRATPLALFRQYRNYGIGRLRNLLKHRERPKLRQLLPVAVLPATLLLIFTPLLPIAAVPFFCWAILCIGYGALIAYRAKQPTLAMSGPAAMLMHSGWSLGFWQGLLTHKKSKPA